MERAGRRKIHDSSPLLRLNGRGATTSTCTPEGGRCKMKKVAVLCSVVLIVILPMISACQTTDENIPVYAGPAVSGELPNGWQKTTITGLEHLLGTQLPVPTYLPAGYEIKEVYYSQEPNSTPPVTEILLLISEQRVQWVGNKYTCRLALSLGWNEAGLGLKMPWAEFIPDIRGRLEDKSGEYILWWESYGSPKSLGSTLRLHASNQFSKEELVRIAASTPSSSPASTSASAAGLPALSQQSNELPLRIMSVTSPVRPGVNATLVAQTILGAECSIIIDYGPSGVQSLRPKIADGSGKVSWTWTVGNFRGEWEIVVKANYGGETAYRSIFFMVQ